MGDHVIRKEILVQKENERTLQSYMCKAMQQ